ncbi:MAG: MmgE/PrpD family protein [Candidatus Baltobacteraceae bacterium]
MISLALARHAADLRWATLPADVRDRVQDVLLDALACEAAGRRSVGHRRLVAVTERAQDAGASTRAFLAGAAIHAIEFDDAHKRSKTHPAAPIIPAVREAAHLAGASGPATLAAVVAGYETMLRLGAAVGASAHRRAGWHATCTTGAIGAATGASRALGLDAEITAEAIGHAVALMAGNFAFYQEGAIDKPVQVGNAARVGLLAALMAAEGMRGSRSALETEDGGFFKLFGGDPAAAVADFDAFHIREVAFKPYPCCRTVQGAIDAAFSLRPLYHGGSVRVRTFAICVEQNGFYAAGSAARAPFSLPYVVAAAFADGRIDLETFTPERVAALSAAEREVSWTVDPAIDARYPEDWPCEVEIDGAAPVRVDVATGDPRNPMPPDRWEAKLRTCAGAKADRLARDVRAMAEPVPA